MDTDTIATLKTVCTAGRATGGFNGDCNERLDQLVDSGLLTATDDSTAPGRHRRYKPTAKGRELLEQLKAKGVA